MFKLPSLPTAQDKISEMADFAELLSWHWGSISEREILSYLGQVDDNDFNVGCDDDESRGYDSINDVMTEIERRTLACNSGYPFQLLHSGTVLKHIPKKTPHPFNVYRYLLLSTRLNMKDNRLHAGIDGSLLFEDVCAHILKNYLGKEHARTIVFGTAVSGNFEDKVNDLCNNLFEGGAFTNPNATPVTAKDDVLDVVAWIPFTDLCSSQLIVFSQCKTGTSWKNDTVKLRPETFIQKWMSGNIASMPIRSFCVAESCDRALWNGTALDSGLLLDRCRLIDFCGKLPSQLHKNVVRWTSAAKATINFEPA